MTDATPNRRLPGSMLSSAQAVLEQMCFLSVLEQADPGPAEETDVAVRVAFRGEPSGAFYLIASESAARAMASGFLGVDSAPSDSSKVEEVVCEIANMICGATLSEWATTGDFVLAGPEIASASAVDRQPGLSRRTLVLDEGAVTTGVVIESS